MRAVMALSGGMDSTGLLMRLLMRILMRICGGMMISGGLLVRILLRICGGMMICGS